MTQELLPPQDGASARLAGQALARKWRPRTFEQLVGQEHVVRALTNALRQNRLHHAYLLTGTRGVGKTTLARVLAKALNCETGVTPAPCGVCSACVEIDGGRFVDLLELDAASNTQVDSMRELLENALYAPTRGRFKVYIIDEVHMLSRSAFNAMLKTLEEPPEHVKFVLATTDPQKVPVTVLSRCLQFNLKQIPAPQIGDRLQQILREEHLAFEPAAVNLVARAAQGSLRDALSLLDQAIAYGAGKVEERAVRAMLGTVDRAYLFAILAALVAREGARLLTIADDMQARSISFEASLQDLASLLHRIALAQTLPESIAADDPDRDAIAALAASLAPEDIQLYYQIALQGRADLPIAPDEYAGFTMSLLRMLAFAPEESPAGSASAGPADAKPAAMSKAPSQSADAPTQWPKLAAALKIGGMARMLAQHCELIGEGGDRMELRVPEAHRHLLDKAYRDKLQGALEEHLGRRIKLEFTLGAATGNTPAERENELKHTRQQRAIEAIDSDPFVRELVESFDARVVDESIRPVEAADPPEVKGAST